MFGAGVGILGVYPGRAEAEEGLDLFRLSGYKTEEISAVLPVGGTVGGVLSWLSNVQVIEVRGAGPVVAAGPMRRPLAENGLAATLAALGASKPEAKLFETRVKRGGGLVAVHCGNNDWLGRARSVFERSGAADIALVGKPKAAVSAGSA